MAFGAGHIVKADVGQFIPAMWSDEVVAAYKSNLVIANLVTKLNHNGKKGDTIYVPKPTRGAAAAKVAETIVTFNNPAVTQLALNINKHYEYSVFIEDIVEVQALESMRRFYTDDAGYALAKQVDTDLFKLAEGLNAGATTDGSYGAAYIGSDGATLYSKTANTNTGNGTNLADIGIRKLIQRLDDADVPMMGRTMVVPPNQKNVLMGLDRFVLWTNVGEAAGANTIRNGGVGDVYGMQVYISTNCPEITAADATTKYRVGMMFHKSALAHVEQMSVRSQTQYKQEYLADLFTADTIYGVGELRDDAGFAFVVPK